MRLLSTFSIFILFLACKSKTGGAIEIIDKTTVQKEIIGRDVQLIDVRTPQEYEVGYIDDAVNFNIMDRDTFLKQITILNKNKPVYLYCKMGGRSSRAADLLKENGFTQIFNYSGGYNDWVTD